MQRPFLVGVSVLFAPPAIAAFGACGGVNGVDDLFSLTGNGGAGTTSGLSSSSGDATAASSTASSSGATASSGSASASSSGGLPVSVWCNSGPCELGEICCINPDGPGDHCARAGACASGYVELDCNGPEDCPGAVCCATVDVNLQVPYLGMACHATCDAMNERVVCSVDDPGVCPAGTKCYASGILGPGYNVCWPG